MKPNAPDSLWKPSASAFPAPHALFASMVCHVARPPNVSSCSVLLNGVTGPTNGRFTWLCDSILLSLSRLIASCIVLAKLSALSPSSSLPLSIATLNASATSFFTGSSPIAPSILSLSVSTSNFGDTPP